MPSNPKPVEAVDDQPRLLCVAIGVIGLSAIEAVFGAEAVDAVLSRMWERLRSVCDPDTVIARAAPDRVIVVMRSSGGDALIVNRLLATARRPMPSPIGELVVGCAAGAATGRPRHRGELVARAERFLSDAVARGPGAVEWERRTRAVSRARRRVPSSSVAATTTDPSRQRGTTGSSAGSGRGGTPTSGRGRRTR